MFLPAADATSSKEVVPGVQLTSLAVGRDTHLCRFLIAEGAVIPRHQHPQEQTGYLISGKLEFDVEGEAIVAGPGDSWSIAASVPHGARALVDTVVIEVFAPVRQDYLPDAGPE